MTASYAFPKVSLYSQMVAASHQQQQPDLNLKRRSYYGQTTHAQLFAVRLLR
jgi:hypothetical protein